MLNEFENQVRSAELNIELVNAADWLASEPPEPDQILQDIFDAGDKLAVIGSSKLRKSFLLCQMAMNIVAGRGFLKFHVPKKRRVLYCQFEIRARHQHSRIRNLSRALKIDKKDIGDRLQILNGRGLGINGPEGIEQIISTAAVFRPEVIFFDPLYKLSKGVENAAEDMKILLAEFDKIAEQTGAAVTYSHHDAKGSPGDRDIRDRGAGSNVLGRDYDACFALTSHATDPDAAVVEVLLRNYRPQDPFTIVWDCADSGYCFRVDDGILPEKMTSSKRRTHRPMTTYLPIAREIFSKHDGSMKAGPFKALFKEKTGLSDHRVRDFLNWAQAGGNPYIEATEERSRGMYRKTLRMETNV